MKRIIVVGSPGAGKSTFARRLGELTGLPVHHLDLLWHRPDRSNVTQAEFDAALEGVLQGEGWIIDGNYSRTLERRMEACDTVFFLDYPLDVCLAGARDRIGKKREDFPYLETELDPEFYQWILDFPKDHLPRLYRLVERYRGSREVVVFRSREEAEAYLAAWGQGVRAGGKMCPLLVGRGSSLTVRMCPPGLPGRRSRAAQALVARRSGRNSPGRLS